LGFCRIGGKGEYIVISRRKRASEAGFSLLIKEPGPYKLKSAAGKTVCLRVSGEGGANGFYTGLPLVLRFAGNDDVVSGRGGKRLTRRLATGGCKDAVIYAAQDGAGVAAFIVVCPGSAVILRREAAPDGELFLCTIGGIDVQQSER
jgi:hypothetical protein